MIRKDRRKKMFIICLGVLLLILFFYWQNNDIVITKSVYSASGVPKAFDGFKILQISDLHNKEFGKNQSELMKYTKKLQPDIIVVTGDLIDSHRTDIAVSMEYISQAVKLAPVYYVTGNHEKRSELYTTLEKQLINAGVNLLDNRSILLERNQEVIVLAGMGDPYLLPREYGRDAILEDILSSVSSEVPAGFKILLSHRPELIDLYAKHGFDLVFSGHAHGGQFRLPGFGGVIAPDQGLFPKYTSGVIKKNQTSMYVSRGLGNSVIPVRIFNRPELVVVTLKHEE